MQAKYNESASKKYYKSENMMIFSRARTKNYILLYALSRMDYLDV